eukprot:8650770-Pyramimonas_sp.AAC.1
MLTAGDIPTIWARILECPDPWRPPLGVLRPGLARDILTTESGRETSSPRAFRSECGSGVAESE